MTKKKPKKVIVKPVSEEEFKSLDGSFRTPDRLIAAVHYQDQIWILSSYWPANKKEPEFYLGQLFLPDRDGGTSTPLETFLKMQGDQLMALSMAKQKSLLEQGMRSEISFQEAINQMRSCWLQNAYHKRKNERAELAAWLKSKRPDSEEVNLQRGGESDEASRKEKNICSANETPESNDKPEKKHAPPTSRLFLLLMIIVLGILHWAFVK